MVYVLHVFQKKSKRGISTPKQDMDLIKKRLKEALRLAGHKADEKMRPVTSKGTRGSFSNANIAQQEKGSA